jgi:hypothetical protein
MIPLHEQFRYHTPVTDERKQQHEEINESVLKCAETIVPLIEDEAWKQKIIDALQQARMLANQAVTFQELQKQKAEREAIAIRRIPLDELKKRLIQAKRLTDVPVYVVQSALSNVGKFSNIDEELLLLLRNWKINMALQGRYLDFVFDDMLDGLFKTNGVEYSHP